MDDLSVFFDTQTIHHDYCLQPIVVKPREDGSYEVIDGQQRLTTLLLLMQYSDPFKSGGNYSIAYATRPDSREFLHSLNADSPATSEHAEDNPDFHHMALALETMRNWAREHGKDRPDMFNFLSVFRRRTKVIWYEITSGKDESIESFPQNQRGQDPPDQRGAGQGSAAIRRWLRCQRETRRSQRIGPHGASAAGRRTMVLPDQ